MLHSLTLTNFQKHRALSLDFTPGLNLITGPNWAGKSTVQRAILFALFGARATGVTGEDLITRGERSLLVELEFDDLRVERGTTKAKLTRRATGEVVATGQSAVTGAIETALGLSAATFRAFRVTTQKEAALLLQAGSTKLSQHLNEITGVDVVDRVLGKLKTEQDVLAGRLHGMDLYKLTENLRLLTDREAEFEQMLQKNESELQQLTSEQAEVERVAEQAKAERDRLLQQAEVAHQAESALAACTARLHSADAMLKECGEEPSARPEALLAELSERIQVAEEAIQARRPKEAVLERCRLAVDGLLERQAVLQQGQTAAPDPAAVAEAAKEREQADQALSAALHEFRSLSALLESAVCPTCQRPFELDQKALQEKRSQLAQLGLDIEILSVSAREASANFNYLVAAEQDYAHRQAELQGVEDRLASAQGEIVALAADLSNLPEASQEDLAHLKRQLEEVRYERMAHAHWLKSHTSLVQYREELLAELSTLPAVVQVKAEDVTHAVKFAEQREQWAAHMRLRISECQANEAAARKEIAFTRGHIQQQKLLLADAEVTTRRQELVKRLAKYLRDNRDRFAQETWERVLSFANQFITAATSGAVTGLSRTAEGDFVYLEEGREMPITLASGLQEDILGTGLKLALGAAIGGPADVALFDEITSAGSDDNALLLTSLLRGTGPQIVLVSHRQADTAVADHVIDLPG